MRVNTTIQGRKINSKGIWTPVVVLDPGHTGVVAGGYEPLGPGSSEMKAKDTSGTEGIATGVAEYQLTLKVAKQLSTALKKQGCKVVMTRTNSKNPLSCIQRAKAANKAKADAYLRIHANGSSNSSINGAMTICVTKNNRFVSSKLYKTVHIKAPDFGCSAFTLQEADGNVLMGRNYDFKRDTSAMLVYCEPKGGYKSVAFAALDNISANIPDASMKKKLATLTAPFICLDGMNEKGVSMAVLTLDSEPVHQNTGKPVIGTTLVIRLILDRAATTEEAVELLNQYDMFATSGRDRPSEKLG